MIRHPLTWIALGVALMAFLLWDRSPRDLLAPRPGLELQFPHAYTLGVQTWEYHADGHLEYHMEAGEVTHFQHLPARPGPLDYTLINNPLMTFYGNTPEDLPWQLRARQGRSDAEGSVITLELEVRAWKASDAPESLMELTTEQLIVKPSEQFAHTDKAVKMRSPQGVTDAVGMRAWLDQDRLELLSQVRGAYEP